MKVKILSVLILSILTITARAQQDSLRIYFQGVNCNEKYKFYYNDKLLGIYSCNGKTGLNYIAIVKDAKMIEGDWLKIKIYRKGRFQFKYSNTYFSASYEPSKKYLLIYRNTRLKNCFAIEPMWRDELIKYR